MPAVLCGLACFEAPHLLTAGAVAREFASSLDPALESQGGCAVEVYRLERLSPDAELNVDDAVVCRIPGWHFDFLGLEDLHKQLEELRLDNNTLQVQHSRTKEALVCLNDSVEAQEIARLDSAELVCRADCMDAAETAQQLIAATDMLQHQRSSPTRRGDGQREVLQLRQQLAHTEKKQQETKSTVIALRSEFMQLVDMMADAGGPASNKYQATQGVDNLALVMRELEPQQLKSCWGQDNIANGLSYDLEKLSLGGAFDLSGLRHIGSPQPPSSSAPGARRTGGSSPRKPGNAAAITGGAPNSYAGQRPNGRPRGTHQRGVHSAGASGRHRPGPMDAGT